VGSLNHRPRSSHTTPHQVESDASVNQRVSPPGPCLLDNKDTVTLPDPPPPGWPHLLWFGCPSRIHGMTFFPHREVPQGQKLNLTVVFRTRSGWSPPYHGGIRGKGSENKGLRHTCAPGLLSCGVLNHLRTLQARRRPPPDTALQPLASRTISQGWKCGSSSRASALQAQALSSSPSAATQKRENLQNKPCRAGCIAEW
jgi:hypothetical protein